MNTVPSPVWTLHVDVATTLLDDAEDDRETEAGSLAARLGGEKRFEHVLERPVLDAFARVANLQHHRPALFERVQTQASAPGHRVAGVHGEVDDHLLQLHRIDAHVKARRALGTQDGRFSPITRDNSRFVSPKTWCRSSTSGWRICLRLKANS